MGVGEEHGPTKGVSWHLLNTQYAMCARVCTRVCVRACVYVRVHLFLTLITLLGDRLYYPHFTDKEISSEILSDPQRTLSGYSAPLRVLA